MLCLFFSFVCVCSVFCVCLCLLCLLYVSMSVVLVCVCCVSVECITWVCCVFASVVSIVCVYLYVCVVCMCLCLLYVSVSVVSVVYEVKLSSKTRMTLLPYKIFVDHASFLQIHSNTCVTFSCHPEKIHT